MLQQSRLKICTFISGVKSKKRRKLSILSDLSLLPYRFQKMIELSFRPSWRFRRRTDQPKAEASAEPESRNSKKPGFPLSGKTNEGLFGRTEFACQKCGI